MDPSRADLNVSDRWRRDGDGAHYADRRFRSARAQSRDPRLVARLLSRFAPASPPIRRVLDVPCGAGRLREGLIGSNSEAPRWVGADISEEMLAALARSPGADLPPETLRADASRLPFADGSFDLVVCCRLLHHLPDPDARQAVLDELVRVSRGLIIASYWDAGSYQAWRRRTRGPLRRRKGGETRQAIQWDELSDQVCAAGADPLGRNFSLRYVSQQAFFAARKRDFT